MTTIQTETAKQTAPGRGEVRAMGVVLAFPEDPDRAKLDRLLARHGLTLADLEARAESRQPQRGGRGRHLAAVS